MSEFANPAGGDASAQTAYTRSILNALGDLDPLAVLRETPKLLYRIVAEVRFDRIMVPESPGKWSIGHVIQHLADSELVGANRFRMLMAYDRPVIAAYDQDLWAERLGYSRADPTEALEEFTHIRRSNVRLFERASSEDRARIGIHSERGEESLEHMLNLYAGHDIVHLRQIHRIREAVGA